jgi:hypothetical protein
MASPGEGLVPRSEMAQIPHMSEGGEVPAEPGLLSALSAWWRNRGEPNSKQVAEEMHKKLPDQMSARSAVERRRADLKKMDEQTKPE